MALYQISGSIGPALIAPSGLQNSMAAPSNSFPLITAVRSNVGLLDPLEEQFHLPATLVQRGNRQRRQCRVVGQKNQRLARLRILESNAPQMLPRCSLISRSQVQHVILAQGGLRAYRGRSSCRTADVQNQASQGQDDWSSSRRTRRSVATVIGFCLSFAPATVSRRAALMSVW